MAHDVSAILLAAGASRRMGKTKQLLPLGGRPAIVRCLESITGASVNDIVVVVAVNCDEILAAIEDFAVTIVQNEIPDGDMSESVRVGFGKVSPVCSGVFVCLADHPMVKAETLITMRRCHAERPHAMILPVYHGQKGHPPLLPREILAEIKVCPTLRDVIQKHSGEVYCLAVDDEGVVLDMDTWEDYQRMLPRFSRDSSLRP